jgi:hypothetical protein
MLKTDESLFFTTSPKRTRCHFERSNIAQVSGMFGVSSAAEKEISGRMERSE